MKKKVSQAQNNWFVFKETSFTKEGCTDLHTPAGFTARDLMWGVGGSGGGWRAKIA